mgnify:CR=1 FL=1
MRRWTVAAIVTLGVWLGLPGAAEAQVQITPVGIDPAVVVRWDVLRSFASKPIDDLSRAHSTALIVYPGRTRGGGTRNGSGKPPALVF